MGTIIPPWQYRFTSAQRDESSLIPVRTSVVSCIDIPCVVLLLFCTLPLSSTGDHFRTLGVPPLSLSSFVGFMWYTVQKGKVFFFNTTQTILSLCVCNSSSFHNFLCLLDPPPPSLCILDMYAAHTQKKTCRILGLSTYLLLQINRRKDPQSHIFNCA